MHNQELELIEMEIHNVWVAVQYAVNDKDLERIVRCYHALKALYRKLEKEKQLTDII